jgi:hypothetical protein
VSADSVLRDFAKEGTGLIDFHKPLPGAFPSQPLQAYAKNTQLPASSLHRHRPEVFQSGILATSIVACKKLSLAILAIFNAKHMLDCSSCS